MRFQLAAEQLTKRAKRFYPFLSVFYAFYPFSKRSEGVLWLGNATHIMSAGIVVRVPKSYGRFHNT